jgi:hypothetical protein
MAVPLCLCTEAAKSISGGETEISEYSHKRISIYRSLTDMRPTALLGRSSRSERTGDWRSMRDELLDVVRLSTE